MRMERLTKIFEKYTKQSHTYKSVIVSRGVLRLQVLWYPLLAHCPVCFGVRDTWYSK